MTQRKGSGTTRPRNTSQKATEREVDFLTDVSLEKTILGCMVMYPDLVYEASAARLKPEDFALQSNRLIYMAMLELSECRVPLDLITVDHYLDTKGELDFVGGSPYLSSLITDVPEQRTPNLAQYIDILRDKSMRRRLVAICESGGFQARDPGDPLKWTLTGLHDDLLRMQGDADEKRVMRLSEFSQPVMDNIEALMAYHPDHVIGVPFGLPELDGNTSGMRPGQFIVVGGFPKSGKTAFAIDTCRKIVRGSNPLPVAFFSREMLKEEILERLLSQESQIPYAKIRKPMNLTTAEWKLLKRTREKIDTWPLFIDDTVESISELIPRAHLMIKKENVVLNVVDYIQIVGAPGDKSYDRVTYVTNQLTALAKKTKVPVMALSQLTRPGDRKEGVNTRPTMSMLRESGQIEQNAHLILFTYHPVDDKNNATGEDEIIMGAQRAGKSGPCPAYFDGAIQQWQHRGAIEAPKAEQKVLVYDAKTLTAGEETYDGSSGDNQEAN
jgi:replicative DNA helicase